MRKITQRFLLIAFLCQAVLTQAQVGIGTTTPSNASMLEVSGGDATAGYKGMMPPRVPTDTERDAIAPVAADTGLLVFVESTGCLNIWNGTAWEDVYCLGGGSSVVSGNVWINEFHYDNIGTDTGEFVEVAGTAGVDLTGYALFFTDGATGNVYRTINLSGTIPDDGSGFGALFFLPGFGIQNGGTDGDGIALVSPTNAIIQNLSYENTFIINEPGNVLNGMSTTIIGVVETNVTTAAGTSLQLQGTGNVVTDFTWGGPVTETPGAVNTGQTFM